MSFSSFSFSSSSVDEISTLSSGIPVVATQKWTKWTDWARSWKAQSKMLGVLVGPPGSGKTWSLKQWAQREKSWLHVLHLDADSVSMHDGKRLDWAAVHHLACTPVPKGFTCAIMVLDLVSEWNSLRDWSYLNALVTDFSKGNTTRFGVQMHRALLLVLTDLEHPGVKSVLKNGMSSGVKSRCIQYLTLPEMSLTDRLCIAPPQVWNRVGLQAVSEASIWGQLLSSDPDALSGLLPRDTFRIATRLVHDLFQRKPFRTIQQALDAFQERPGFMQHVLKISALVVLCELGGISDLGRCWRLADLVSTIDIFATCDDTIEIHDWLLVASVPAIVNPQQVPIPPTIPWQMQSLPAKTHPLMSMARHVSTAPIVESLMEIEVAYHCIFQPWWVKSWTEAHCIAQKHIPKHRTKVAERYIQAEWAKIPLPRALTAGTGIRTHQEARHLFYLMCGVEQKLAGVSKVSKYIKQSVRMPHLGNKKRKRA